MNILVDDLGKDVEVIDEKADQRGELLCEIQSGNKQWTVSKSFRLICIF